MKKTAETNTTDTHCVYIGKTFFVVHCFVMPLCCRETEVLNCVSAVKPSINYFRDVDRAVNTLLSKQSFVPPFVTKYCK